MRINTNPAGPVFPMQPKETGMTLRDWFAGQALAGICANPDTANLDEEQQARLAYRVADAMIAARGGAQ